MKTRIIIRNLLFSFFLFIVVLSIIECFARLFYPEQPINTQSKALPLWVISNMKDSNFEPDRLRFWKVPPSSQRLHTNIFGLRGIEFAPEKAPSVVRIITLGDSCTWGFGVQPFEEYPWILQKILDRYPAPHIYEVLNAGVPGYSSLQGLRYFKELLRYKPDIVTIYFGRNDHRFLQEEGGYTPDHEVPVLPEFLYQLKTLLSNFRSYQLLRSKIIQFREKHAGVQKYGRGKTIRSKRTFRIEPDEFEGNILEILEIADSRSIMPIVITSPVFPDIVGNYNDILRKICTSKNVALIEADKEFIKHGGNAWLVDDCHPSPEGHRWLAEEIAKRIFLSTPKTSFH